MLDYGLYRISCFANKEEYKFHLNKKNKIKPDQAKRSTHAALNGWQRLIIPAQFPGQTIK